MFHIPSSPKMNSKNPILQVCRFLQQCSSCSLYWVKQICHWIIGIQHLKTLQWSWNARYQLTNDAMSKSRRMETSKYCFIFWLYSKIFKKSQATTNGCREYCDTKTWRKQNSYRSQIKLSIIYFTLYFHSFLLVMFMNKTVMMNGEGERLNRQKHT